MLLSKPGLVLRVAAGSVVGVGLINVSEPQWWTFVAVSIGFGVAFLRYEHWHRTQLAEADRLKDAIVAESARQSAVLANLSHEIRTPLNGIVGMAELLASDPEITGESREHVVILSRSTAALLALLNDVLDLAKLNAGELQLHVEEVSIAALVRETVGLFAGVAVEKGLLLEIVVPESVDWVRLDGTRLRQILSNFISNALKFTREGGITVAVSASGRAEGAFDLSFHVTDTGCGMSTEVCERLFRPFTQADASTAGRHGGTGLGLAISKRLAEMMGGAVGVMSKEGSGSTFWCTVPVQAAEFCVYEPVPPAFQHSGSGVAGVRILVAEDTVVNQKVVERLLSRLGCEVEIVGDGCSAVAAVQRSPFDVILMDCHMPLMDGFEATRSIRALAGAVGKIPIVALTASADAQDRERCIAVGMNDFLPKPFRPDELVAVVQRCRPRH